MKKCKAIKNCFSYLVPFLIGINFFGISLISNLFLAKPVEAGKISIRLGTGKEGSSGYSCAVGIASSIKKRHNDIDMVAIPTPGSSASVKIFAKGGADTAYASTWTLRDAYNNTGPFAQSPVEEKPLQGWYYLTAEWFVIVEANNEDIKTLNDLRGKKFYPHPAGTGIFDVYKMVLEKLNLWEEVQIRQIDSAGAADALQMGTIDAVGGVSVLMGKNAPPWIRDIDSRLEIKIISPSAEEKEKIKKMQGLSTGVIPKDWMRPKNQELNSGDVWGWYIHYGFHPGKNMPTEIMYKIYKTWIEYAKEDLAPVNATLKGYSERPLKTQLLAIEEAKDIPVHPGVAKYLKERGLWKDHWIIGELNPGVL